MTLLTAEPILSPAVQDKIDNIIRRLENGEQLAGGSLRRNGKFCVLGLFADESGLGHWASDGDNDATYILDHPELSPKYVHGALGGDLVEFYNLNSDFGMFHIKDVPDELQDRLRKHPRLNHQWATYDLTIINDRLVVEGEIPNQLLADVIKSGAIFRKPPEPQETFAL